MILNFCEKLNSKVVLHMKKKMNQEFNSIKKNNHNILLKKWELESIMRLKQMKMENLKFI